MKSTAFSIKQFIKQSAVAAGIAIAFLSARQQSTACGPYYKTVHDVSYFTYNDADCLESELADREQRNIALWKKATDGDISSGDVSKAVYKDDTGTFIVSCTPFAGAVGNGRNGFYRYIRENNDTAAVKFLLTAKAVEEKRRKDCNWGYGSANTDKSQDDYLMLADRCIEGMKSNPEMADRYGLQCVRSLFAANRWDDCINFYNENMASLPDDNLFREMAADYVAGCLMETGNYDIANRYFAQKGDIMALEKVDAMTYMARHNPDSPSLKKRISNFLDLYEFDNDSISKLNHLTDLALQNLDLKYRGDWELLKAVIMRQTDRPSGEVNSMVAKALSHDFSTNRLANSAKLLSIALKGDKGDVNTILDDLKWLESMAASDEITGIDNNTIENIIYTHWLPALDEKGDYATAMLLSSYSDNINRNGFYSTLGEVYDNYYSWEYIDPDKVERLSAFPGALVAPVKNLGHTPIPDIDFGSLSFQYMNTLKPEQLAEAKLKIDSTDTELYSHLKKNAITDNDYYNEVIGTRFLACEQYDSAVDYLANVSDGYQYLLNTFSEGYLGKNPFVVEGMTGEIYDLSGADRRKISPLNAKLNFARRMGRLSDTIKNCTDQDERSLALAEYATGYFNSLNSCWALTSYWNGYPGSISSSSSPLKGHRVSNLDLIISSNPYVKDIELEYDPANNEFVYMTRDGRRLTDEEADYLFDADSRRYEFLIKEARETAVSDEAKAMIELALGNTKTIARHYRGTEAAKFLSTHCDNWKNWL